MICVSEQIICDRRRFQKLGFIASRVEFDFLPALSIHLL